MFTIIFSLYHFCLLGDHFNLNYPLFLLSLAEDSSCVLSGVIILLHFSASFRTRFFLLSGSSLHHSWLDTRRVIWPHKKQFASEIELFV
jgi:hypothetical protein